MAVWSEQADPGAVTSLSEHRVTGVIQWADATAQTWPRLVAVIRAGSTYWSRPFDVLDRRRVVADRPVARSA